MMRLRTWLAHYGTRAHDHLSTSWTEVRKIVQDCEALEREVRKRGVILRVCDDADRFKAIVEAEDERQKYRPKAERPILASHCDPVARNLTPQNFFGMVGQRIGLNSPLFTTNTLCLYPKGSLRDLFTSQRLFCDYEEDAPYQSIQILGDAPELDASDTYCHGGTMWTNPDRRGEGIGSHVAKLVVRVGWLRWGFPVFGTVMAGKGHEKLFDAPRVIGTAICQPRDGQAIHTPITLYRKEDFLTSPAGPGD